MGLATTIRMGGIPLGYHRIRFLMVDVNQLNTIEILSYLNEEERNREGDLEDPPYMLQWSVETEYDPFMSVNSAYAHLKTLSDFADAEDVIDLWAAGTAYYTGDLVMYEEQQYECIQPHTSQEGWEPPNIPALWKRHSPGGEVPEWVQPAGSQDAYAKGDVVAHNGKTWTSDVDGNVWEPGVYGWSEGGE